MDDIKQENSETDEQPKGEITPLGMDFVRVVAEQWGNSAQAQAIIPKLPQGMAEMFSGQSNDFLLGFANGIQAMHDLVLKTLLDDINSRLSASSIIMPGQAMPSSKMPHATDRLIIASTSLIEGIGYLACKELASREKKDVTE